MSLQDGEGGSLSEKTQPVLEKFYEVAKVVFPVIFSVVAVAIIIKLILLGMKLARSGDDPEQRSKTIKGLIWWGVGLVMTIAAIAATATVFTTISGQKSIF